MEKLFPSLDSRDVLTNINHRAAYLIVPLFLLAFILVRKFIKCVRAEYKRVIISDGSRGGTL